MSKFHKDLIERVVWTAVQAFLATLIITDTSTLQTAAIAGLAAALSVVKSYAATKVGDHESAATLK